MPKKNFTTSFIQKVKCEKDKKKIIYSDIKIKGLILEVRHTGTKTFYFRYNLQGKTYQKKIAFSDQVSLKEAREMVKKHREINFKLQNMEKHKCITLNQFWEQYYYPHILIATKSPSTQESFYRNYIKPFFGDTSMAKIKSAELSKHQMALVSKYNLAKSTANKLIRVLSSIYNKAILWEMEGVSKNPVKILKEFKTDSKKEVFLDEKEIATLLEVIDNYTNNINLSSIIRFLLLTGARRSEVLRAKWENIDFKNKIWTIPDTKSNKIRKVSISNSLEVLLRKIPTKDSVYIFPSPITKIPMRCIFKHWNKVRKKANLAHVRLHDLRHTTASILVNKGVSIYQVQQILGHSDISMTMRYAHLSNNTLSKAMCVMDSVVN